MSQALDKKRNKNKENKVRINYRLLLKKYMAHILFEEGITYVHYSVGDYYNNSFSADEVKALRKIDKEMEEKTNKIPPMNIKYGSGIRIKVKEILDKK